MAQNLSELANYYEDVNSSPYYVAYLVAWSIAEKRKGSRKSVKSILKEGVTLPRDYLDGAFLFESEGYLKKALYHYLAYKHVQSGGYQSWAEVTRYYGRFWGIVALLRLTGVGVFWEKDIGPFKVVRNPSGYIVTQTKGSGSHKNTWELFSDTFKNFEAPKEYEMICAPLGTGGVSNKGDFWEKEWRNWINYDIRFGYGEIYTARDSIIDVEKRKGARQFLDWESFRSKFGISTPEMEFDLYLSFVEQAGDERIVFDTFIFGLKALQMIADAKRAESFELDHFLSIVENFTCAQEIKDIVAKEITQVSLINP